MTTRTPTQNNALHLYLERLATALADSGQDMRQVIQVPIKPTKENVKELMLKPVMNALYPDITSTTKLSTAQVSELYETMNAATSERLGVSVTFPSHEELIQESIRRHEARAK